jgi:hypothetical protein
MENPFSGDTKNKSNWRMGTVLCNFYYNLAITGTGEKKIPVPGTGTH